MQIENRPVIVSEGGKKISEPDDGVIITTEGIFKAELTDGKPTIRLLSFKKDEMLAFTWDELILNLGIPITLEETKDLEQSSTNVMDLPPDERPETIQRKPGVKPEVEPPRKKRQKTTPKPQVLGMQPENVLRHDAGRNKPKVVMGR